MYYELFIPEYKHVEEINLLTWKEYAKNTTVFTIDLPSEIFFEWEFEFWKIGEVKIFLFTYGSN